MNVSAAGKNLGAISSIESPNSGERKTIKKRATAKRAHTWIYFMSSRGYSWPAWKLQFSRSDYVSNRARATTPLSSPFSSSSRGFSPVLTLRSQEIAIIDSKDSTKSFVSGVAIVSRNFSRIDRKYFSTVKKKFLVIVRRRDGAMIFLK